MLWFKKIIKQWCWALGLDVRLAHRHKRIIDPQIVDPIQYNQEAWVNALYADAARVKKYQRDMGSFYADVLHLLASEKGWPGKRILDVGCGTGELLHLIAQRYPGCALTGLEYAEAPLRLAQAKLPTAKFDRFDIYQPLGEKYDVVLCTEVLEHLLYPERALPHLLAAIDPPGFALLTVPDGRQDAFAGHIHYWSPESWLLFLQSHTGTWLIQTGTFHRGTKNYAIIRKPEGGTA